MTISRSSSRCDLNKIYCYDIGICGEKAFQACRSGHTHAGSADLASLSIPGSLLLNGMQMVYLDTIAAIRPQKWLSARLLIQLRLTLLSWMVLLE